MQLGTMLEMQDILKTQWILHKGTFQSLEFVFFDQMVANWTCFFLNKNGYSVSPEKKFSFQTDTEMVKTDENSPGVHEFVPKRYIFLFI